MKSLTNRVTSIRNRPSGSELTLGSIGKISNAVADARDNIAKLDGMLSDLNCRLDRLEHQRADERPPMRIAEPQP